MKNKKMSLESLVERLKTILIIITIISFIVCIIFFTSFQPPQRDAASSAKSGQYNELMMLGAIVHPDTFRWITYISFITGFISLIILRLPNILDMFKNRKILFSKEKNNKKETKNDVEDLYIGNSKTKIFHNKNCTKLPNDEIKVIINSRHEAFELGFKPCRNCKP